MKNLSPFQKRHNQFKKSSSFVKPNHARNSRVPEETNESDDNKESDMKNILKRKELDLPVAQMGYDQDLGYENANAYKSPLKMYKDDRMKQKCQK